MLEHLMVSPIVLNGRNGLRVFVNLSGNVGLNSLNQPDDVQLVQLGYASMLVSPQAQAFLSPAERQAFANISPGARYLATANDPLTVAIKAHQASRGGIQDGHVSVAAGSLSYDGGKHSFQIVALNNAIRDVLVKDFPRLDKHPKCPAALKVSVMLMMVGGVG
jgi:hypothetical protein